MTGLLACQGDKQLFFEVLDERTFRGIDFEWLRIVARNFKWILSGKKESMKGYSFWDHFIVTFWNPLKKESAIVLYGYELVLRVEGDWKTKD